MSGASDALNAAIQRTGATQTTSGQYIAPTQVDTATQPSALPAGMTQLTSPSQISSYNIVGQVGATGTPGSYLYGTPKTIAGDTINKGATPVNLNTPLPSTTAADVTMAGAKTSTDINNQTIDQLKSQLDPVSQQLYDLLGQDTGKAQALSAAESANNVPGLQGQLTDINGRIQTGLAEYNQLKAAYDQTTAENRSKPITMDRIIGNEAQISYSRAAALNAKASDIGLLQAQALAVQGQITAAQDAAKKAVDLKYAPIEEQIAIKEEQLKLIQPLLDRAEKAKADALQQQYDAQKVALATAKTQETDYQNMLITAAAAGAPQALLDTARSVNDPVKAASLLSTYLGNTKTGLTEVSPGATLYNPTTGQAVYTAPTTKQLSGTTTTGGTSGTSTGGTTATTTPLKFTASELKDIQAIGAGSFSPEIQNVLINGLTLTERKKFMADFNAAQQAQRMSLDPLAFLKQWATVQDQQNTTVDFNNL